MITLAGWLPDSIDPRRRAVVEEAMSYLGVAELPKGSNRSPTIDKWNAAVGAPLGSPWCASFASVCWAAAIGEFASASTEEWHQWGQRKGRLVTIPQPGDVALYDLETLGKADHAGIVARHDNGYLFVAEGNTAGDGGREGYLAMLHDRSGFHAILGFISLTGGP